MCMDMKSISPVVKYARLVYDPSVGASGVNVSADVHLVYILYK